MDNELDMKCKNCLYCDLDNTCLCTHSAKAFSKTEDNYYCAWHEDVRELRKENAHERIL